MHILKNHNNLLIEETLPFDGIVITSTIQKTKHKIGVASLVFVLITLPLFIDYLLGTTFIISLVLFLFLYPIMLVIFICDKRAMDCKFLP